MAKPTTDETAAPEPESQPEATLLSLDELASASGVAPRTIRFYQTKKLLPKPLKDASDGRIARYDDDHLTRLRMIGELRDHGLKLPAIKELLDASDPQSRISDWLGLSETLRGSWSGDAPKLLTQTQLDEALAGAPTGTLGQLEADRLVARQGDAWLVHNPALFDLTLGLVADDIAVDLVLEAGEILRRHLSKASDQLIELFVKALGEGFGDGDDAGALVHSLRPIAGDAARMIFGQELERAIEDLLADTKRLARATGNSTR